MYIYDENDILNRLNKKDSEAFKEILDKYGNKLLRTCYLILKDEKEAEDVVQETFLRVYKHIHKFKGESSFYTWIYSIALNQCRDRMKKSKRLISVENIKKYLHLDYRDDTENNAIKNIERQSIRDIIDELPSKYREVLILFYFSDMSIKEISTILNQKEGTIKSNLSRGRNILKESIVQGGIVDE